MPSSINSTSSSPGGIITTGAVDNELVLQTGDTTAISIDASQNVTFNNPIVVGTNAINAENSLGFRNRIINGDMRIDQRNAGAAVTVNTDAQVFSVDRFSGRATTSAGAYSLQQDSSAPAGFVNSLKATVTTADGSLAAGDVYVIRQQIEGTNISDLAWGTANAKTVTLSFWVRSSLTGTFGGSLRNSSADRAYPFTYSISVADTWEYKTVTIAGDTSGTWLTTVGVGIQVFFGLGVGSTLSGTAGSWAGAGYVSATGAVSVIGTLNATFYITGVQLEVGSVATPFERLDYGRQLIMCQRYYQTLTMMSGYTGPTNTLIQCSIPFNQMRAAPTFSQSGVFRFDDAAAGYTQSSVSVSTDTVTNSGALLNFSNITVGGNFRPYGKNNAATLNLSAEL